MRVTIRPETAGQSADDRIAETDALVAARRAELDAKQLPPNIDAAHVDEIVAAWRDELLALLEEWREAFVGSFPSDGAAFADLGLLEVFKDPGKQMGTTGLVFAGFGDHDIFPAFSEYRSCGVIAGKHVAIEVKQVAITHDTPAWVETFAQTDMSDTFSLGKRHVFAGNQSRRLYLGDEYRERQPSRVRCGHFRGCRRCR
jgi:hypothetical protein